MCVSPSVGVESILSTSIVGYFLLSSCSLKDCVVFLCVCVCVCRGRNKERERESDGYES